MKTEKKARKRHYDPHELLSILREKYGKKLDSIEGRLEVFEEIVDSGENIWSQIFNFLDEDVQASIFNAEVMGGDVSEYRKKYNRIIDKLDYMNRGFIVEARDPSGNRAFHKGVSSGLGNRVTIPVEYYPDTDDFEFGGYDD